MRLSDWISFGSLAIAIVAFTYTYITNAKKYELDSQYRKEILDWYAATVKILIEFKLRAKSEESAATRDVELRSQLSAQIELGRFYFPNVDKGDRFGIEKPLAYRGYRNVVLEFLVLTYRISERDEPVQYVDHLETLQRHFTSEIFSILDPKRYLADTHRYAGRTFNGNLSLEDFIAQDPPRIDAFL